MKTTAIKRSKKLFAEGSRRKKLFAKTTTPKKIVCVDEMSNPPSKKIMVRPLADWAAWYDSCGKQNNKKAHKKADIDILPLETEDGNNDDELLNSDANSLTSDPSIKSIRKRTQARVIRSVWFNKEAQPEKHYRELIMLFTPWRNEQTDLMGNYSSFQEHYIVRNDEIGEQMRQYAVCSEDLNEIQHHLQECDDMFDTIAPVTQDTERQDEDEGNTDTHPDLN
jgi:hypothetical protein